MKVNFRGYDASKLKNIYMQNATPNAQKDIFNELKNIGEKENIGVYIQNFSNISKDFTEDKTDPWSTWGQDNKIFIRDSGRKYLLLPATNSKGEICAAIDFSQKLNFKYNFSNTVFEGGNVFLGEKQDGNPWILLGEKVIFDSAKYAFLKDKGMESIDYASFLKFLFEKRIEIQTKDGNRTVLMDEYEQNIDKYVEIALNNISKDFNVSRENIHTIPQPNFHIDMAVRPIGYPYILVNDPDLAIQTLDSLGNSNTCQKLKVGSLLESNNKNKLYASCDEVIKSLENQGFIPIRVGGIYGLRGEVNFLNAIVNKHEDGSISYITNSSSCGNPVYDILKTCFENELRKKVSNLRDVYFVSGIKNFREQTNDMMLNLGIYGGGIHCLTLEEPEDIT